MVVMVMETPSPQSVGLQFVRQYYTILNQAPEHLHRFYNTNSSFVHGGIDGPGKAVTPVYGQQEIHKTILQLNFKNCHAKIRLVDSQATLGDGVVVQVTGELSNNGGPMRRFMQTFVLAQQSPKKYYVHNDILRYQDEVFPIEEESDPQEGLVENEAEDDRPDIPDSPTTVPDPPLSHFYGQSNGTILVEEQPVNATVMPSATVPLSAVSTHNSQQSSVSTSMSSSAVSLPASLPLPATIHNKLEPKVSLSPELEKQDYESPEEEEEEEEDDNYQEKASNHSAEQQEDQLSEPTQDEPKTYANMLSKNTSGSGFVTSPNSTGGTAMIGNSKILSNTPSPVRPDIKSDSYGSQMQRPQRPRGNGIRPPVSYSNPRDRINRNVSEDFEETDRRRPIQQYPDSHQLFVGNLPHEVDENALRSVFIQYGNIVDMRINYKPMSKPGGSGRPPSFGFIVFDNPGAVRQALMNKHHFLDEHRLNVEEKKMKRMNNSDMRGRPGMSRGGPMMGNRGGSRGGMGGISRGDGRGGRGGYHPNTRR